MPDEVIGYMFKHRPIRFLIVYWRSLYEYQCQMYLTLFNVRHAGVLYPDG